MPRINEVRFTVKKADADEERYMVDEGTTYRDVLTNELGVNPSKFTLHVNGGIIADLDAEVQNNDVLNLQPQKYSSGNSR